MKKIIENGTEKLNGYDELKKYEQFIYETAGIEFFAFKISDSCAIFVNGKGKFVVAKRYTNCLSLGDYSLEFETFNEAEDYINGEE